MLDGLSIAGLHSYYGEAHVLQGVSLEVARALTLDPERLLRDEPSEGLAPVMVQQLEGILLQLKQTGLAILLVEQNLYSALAVSDEVYVLETGKIVIRGSAADLLRDR